MISQSKIVIGIKSLNLLVPTWISQKRPNIIRFYAILLVLVIKLQAFCECLAVKVGLSKNWRFGRYFFRTPTGWLILKSSPKTELRHFSFLEKMRLKVCKKILFTPSYCLKPIKILIVWSVNIHKKSVQKLYHIKTKKVHLRQCFKYNYSKFLINYVH